MHQMVAQGAQYAQILGVVFLMFGDGLFSMLGGPPPAWFNSIKENRMMAVGVLFLGNSFAQQLVATGAFEIWYDGDLIFSKIEENRWPHPEEIIRALQIRGVPAGGGMNDNSF